MKRKRKKSRPQKLLEDLSKPACQWEWPKIGLFVPTGHNVPAECFWSFMRIQRAHGLPDLPLSRMLQLDLYRTRACEALMRSKTLTHLLMLDADHDHPVDIVAKLASRVIATMDSPEPVEIVAGLNFSRAPGHKACCYADADPTNPWDTQSEKGLAPVVGWPQWGLMEVAIAGTGSMLIAKTALEKLKRPYFFMPSRWNDPTGSVMWPGEDVGFAIRCREAGVKQYIDVECTSPHLAKRWITADDFNPAPHK